MLIKNNWIDSHYCVSDLSSNLQRFSTNEVCFARIYALFSEKNPKLIVVFVFIFIFISLGRNYGWAPSDAIKKTAND